MRTINNISELIKLSILINGLYISSLRNNDLSIYKIIQVAYTYTDK